MNNPYVSDEVLMEAVRAMEENDYNLSKCAKLLGMARGSLRHRLKMAEARGLKSARPNPIGSEIHIAPEPQENAGDAIRELVERKKARMSKSLEREKWEQLIPVQVKDERPIGLFLVGDPHIDDDYCDIAGLERDLTTVGKTPGFFAGHIGDLTNNWVGRLQRQERALWAVITDGKRTISGCWVPKPPDQISVAWLDGDYTTLPIAMFREPERL